MKRNVTSRSRSGIAGPVLSAVMAAALVSWALPAWGVEKETCQVTQIQLGPSTYGEVIWVWLLFGNERTPLYGVKQTLLIFVNMVAPVLLEVV